MGMLRIVKKCSDFVNYLIEVFSWLFLGITILHKSSITL
jgi:hypothetical protein